MKVKKLLIRIIYIIIIIIIIFFIKNNLNKKNKYKKNHSDSIIKVSDSFQIDDDSYKPRYIAPRYYDAQFITYKQPIYTRTYGDYIGFTGYNKKRYKKQKKRKYYDSSSSNSDDI